MSRNRTGQRARRRPELSERDVTTLRLLQRFRLLSVDQIQRITITAGSPATRARRTRGMLQRLTNDGYVRRLDRRIGGVHAGSTGTVYRISGRGSTTLARLDGTERRRSSGEPGERFVRHVLAIGEQAVALYEASWHANMTVDEFSPEPACWRRYPAPHGGTATIRPDAFVLTHDDSYSFATFLEQDMATESTSTVLRKCQAYVAYWRSGVEQARFGVFPRVVWAVPNARRVAQLEAVFARLPREVHELFVVRAGVVAPLLLGRDGTDAEARS
ncbi:MULTISPECIES: replication-relaxation family protein [unclassified Gordonia (in: high G+C Gram-positive bacteria)]|uniref:replication-relaxation family protein n=1 Tax=unclassified Gordonia (in: high G+C Gram-positive bacteria) TaxID=2657482 RepID=UPI00081627A3|nr:MULTISPECIES: replication-relaxation family protein [unclassified Gordonia (in: high G+C Gram-positive bacteria)]SCC56104.1 Replication-relaxation [Gordonia sp. v-85]